MHWGKTPTAVMYSFAERPGFSSMLVGGVGRSGVIGEEKFDEGEANLYIILISWFLLGNFESEL